METFTKELIFQILKYLSILIGSITGFIGIVSETRHQKSRKLTRSGKTLIILLIVSSIVAIMSQLLESHFKQIEENAYNLKRKNEMDTLAIILEKARSSSENSMQSVTKLGDVLDQQEDQLKELEELNSQTLRGFSPLFPLDLSVFITYSSNDTAFNAYIPRLRDKMGCSPYPVDFGSYRKINDIQKLIDHEKFGGEICEPWIIISLFKEGDVSLSNPDMVLYCGRSDYFSQFTRIVTPKNHLNEVHVWCPVLKKIQTKIKTTNPVVKEDNGKITSYIDLNNVTMLISVPALGGKDIGSIEKIDFEFKKTGGLESTIKFRPEDLFHHKEFGKVYKVKIKANKFGVSRAD